MQFDVVTEGKDKRMLLASFVQRQKRVPRNWDFKLLQSVFILLCLSILSPVSTAEAGTVICSPGGMISNSGNGYYRFNADTKICDVSTSSLSPPQNGFLVSINVGPSTLSVGGNPYENGAISGLVSGSNWSVFNYSGQRVNGANGFVLEDTIPGSQFFNGFVVKGLSNVFTAAGVTKTDGTNSVSFGTISVNYPDVKKGANAADKANIADHLLSTFSQVDGGIFGFGGVPETATQSGDQNGDVSGFAVAPNVNITNSGLHAGFEPSNLTNTNNSNFGKRDFGAVSSRYHRAVTAQSLKNTGLNFSFNLKNLLANQHRRELLNFNGVANPIAPATSRWNLWANGRYTDITGASSTNDRDGHLWTTTGGLSYAINKTITVGGFGRLRFGKVHSGLLNSKLQSNFYGLGGYISNQFEDGLQIKIGGLYEHGKNRISIYGADGKFDSNQFSFEADIDKRFTSDSGEYWIEPGVNIRYSEIDRNSYKDSAGTNVGSGDIALGRLRFGPTMGAILKREEATYKPFVRINGVWDFIHQKGFSTPGTTITTTSLFGDLVTTTPGEKISPATSAFLLGGGVEVELNNGIALKLAADWLNIFSSIEATSLSGSITVPFSVFGGQDSPVSAGLVSLDFAGNATSAGSRLKISIPFHGGN